MFLQKRSSHSRPQPIELCMTFVIRRFPKPQIPFAGDDYVAARSKRIYITQRRIDEIGPSEGCEACRSGTYAHTSECVKRFEAAFVHETPPKAAAQEAKAFDASSSSHQSFQAEAHDKSESVAGLLARVAMNLSTRLASCLKVKFPSQCLSMLIRARNLTLRGAHDSISISSQEGDRTPILVAPITGVTACAAIFNDLIEMGLPIECLPEQPSSICGAEHATRAADPKGSGGNVLFEFCCAPDSIIGDVGSLVDVKVVRLSKDVIDLNESDSIIQLMEQISVLPSCSIHGSTGCCFWSVWQHLNIFKYPHLKQKLLKSRKNSRRMGKDFIRAADLCIAGGGHASFEWPRYCAGWSLPELTQWIVRQQLYSVTFDGCMLGFVHDGQLVRNPWRIVTSSARLANALAAYQCNHHGSLRLDRMGQA